MWKNKNVCGRRLGYTGTFICQNSATLHFRLMHFALVKFILKEKKIHKQMLNPSYDPYAEIHKDAVAWCLLLLLKCIQNNRIERGIERGWIERGMERGQV